DLEIPPARSAGNEADLEAAPVRLLHDLEPRPVVPIEYRNTLGQRLIAGAVPRCFGLAREFGTEDVDFGHGVAPCMVPGKRAPVSRTRKVCLAPNAGMPKSKRKRIPRTVPRLPDLEQSRSA